MAALREFNPEFRDVLAKVNGRKNVTAIAQVIKLLKSGQHREVSQSYVDDLASTASAELLSLTTDLDRTRNELNNFLKAADRNLDKLISMILGTITDQKSANEAANFYDVDWFKSLAMSDEAKVRIASELIHAVKAFISVSPNFWQLLVDQDTATAQSAAYQGFNLSTDEV